MPSTTPLTDAINALTTYANTVTSASDTTLSDAVATLAAGYGGGGSSALYKLLDKSITDNDIDWSQVTGVKDWAFYQCASLTSIGNPTIGQLPASGFRSMTGLTSAEVTGSNQLQTYCGSMFRSDTALQTATIHFAYSGNGDVDFGDTYVFSGCTNLQTVIFTHSHATKTLKVRANFMFENCTALRTLVLKTTNLVTLTNGTNANAWGGIYNNPTESTIYVPNALIASYQTASNWSTLYGRGVTFAKIEGSIYE